jgi:L-2-hydroxyglutarate oxidase LhgO
VHGKEMLYRYCRERHVPFQNIGKLIVASRNAETDRLREIRAQAEKNGVLDLEQIGKHQMREREPAIDADTALFSPSTGIIDSHSLMLSLQADIEAPACTPNRSRGG